METPITLEDARLAFIPLPAGFNFALYGSALDAYLSVVSRLPFLWAPNGIVVDAARRMRAELEMANGASFAEESTKRTAALKAALG